MTLTLEQVKLDQQRDREHVRITILDALRDGPATTSALREMFRNYSQKYKKSTFWNRLRELERDKVIARGEPKRWREWEFPETVWMLP